MKVTMMLCDAAQVADGKLYILGGGWTLTGPDPSPSSVALLFEPDADEATRPFSWTLALLNQDGQGVVFGDPDDHSTHQHMSFDGTVEPPQAMVPTAAVTIPFVMNLGPLPLPPGESFTWRLTVNGETRPEWELPFATRPSTPTGPLFPFPAGGDGPADIPRFS